MHRLNIILVLLSASVGCATDGVGGMEGLGDVHSLVQTDRMAASAAEKRAWILKSWNLSGWDVRDEGRFESHLECKEALQEYKEEHPHRRAACF